MDVWNYRNVGLLLDAIFSDCCFGRSQRRISDETAHTSTFDYGGLIDQFAFVVGEVNECFVSKASRGSPTRCRGLFLSHKQMVSPNFLPSSYSTGPVWLTSRPDLTLFPFPLKSNSNSESRSNGGSQEKAKVIAVRRERQPS